MTEAKVWESADLHRGASDALESTRGQQMGALLNVKIKEPKAGCVQCHKPLFSAVDESGKPLKQLANEGVTCEVCHGPPSNWLNPHKLHDDNQKPTWPDPHLDKKLLDKKTELGWIDVHSPVTRAELCVSCHVGSAQHGRVITHDMYAAGHPPLAGFDVELFADLMPRHWRYDNEKPKNNGGDATNRTKNLLVGAVVAMRMAVELVAADAAARPKANRWPELARLDCFACHHELDTPETHQEQAEAHGRPPLIVGCVPLIRIATELADPSRGDEELDAQLAGLRAVFNSQPFGDPGEIVARGGKVIAWCRKIEDAIIDRIDRLPKKNLSSANYRQILKRIANQAASNSGDYDSARQLLGAWVVIYGELLKTDKDVLSDADQQKIDSLLEKLNQAWPDLAESHPFILTCGDLDLKNPKNGGYAVFLKQQFANRESFEISSFRETMTELALIVAPQP
jgi:hypothetical protein